jgi:uncharacterized protein YukE
MKKGIPNAEGAMVNSEGSSPHRRKSVSKESVSKATSELNNLLQIISGTSAEIGNLWEGCESSEQYLNMLRSRNQTANNCAHNRARYRLHLNSAMHRSLTLCPVV